MRGRYAPSPTGPMHLGNARTALLSWLHSRRSGGTHILRIEDLDVGRVRPGAAKLLKTDLLWLGLDWDEEYTQSQRLPHYAQALAELETYPCTCTRREIAEAASAPHALPGVYPQTCLARGPLPGKPAAWRWQVPDETVCIHDHYQRRDFCQNLPREVGDIVLRRSDGVFAYHLAVVVDDALMNITDIVRGEDLLSATPVQVALQRALGYPQPAYYHVPLMTDYHGERLAKRSGAPSVAALRERGTPPEAVLADLARSLGWAVGDKVSAAELLEGVGQPLEGSTL